MNWDLLLKEAIQHLQEYIRIETVNPPGNEMEGAKFFKKIFEDGAIPCQIFESSPGRGNLLATLKGNGKKRPILLLNHMDVVPVEKDRWPDVQGSKLAIFEAFNSNGRPLKRFCYFKRCLQLDQRRHSQRADGRSEHRLLFRFH